MRPIVPARGLAAAPAATWRSLAVPFVVILAVAALALWTALGAFRDSEGPVGARWAFAGIGAAFLLLALGTLAVLATGGNRMPRYETDAEGIALWTRHGSAEVPWSRVLAVGVAHKRPPAVLGSPTVRLKQGEALEVFVSDTDLRAAYPRAGTLVAGGDEPPPAPGLPAERLRVLLPAGGVTEQIHAAVAPYAGDRWLATYERKWRRLPGT